MLSACEVLPRKYLNHESYFPMYIIRGIYFKWPAIYCNNFINAIKLPYAQNYTILFQEILFSKNISISERKFK